MLPYFASSLLAFILVFGAIPGPDAVGKPDDDEKGLKVMLLGSSTFNGSLGHIIEKDLEDRGHDVQRLVQSATGFSRPDSFDWMKKIKRVKAILDMDVVVVYLGGNDAQCFPLQKGERDDLKKKKKRKRKKKKATWLCMNHDQYGAVYKARVTRFLEKVCDMGVMKVVLLPPMDVVSKRFQRRLGKIRTYQLEAAAKVKCATGIKTGGDHWRFVRHPETRRKLRAKDGVHSTRKGSKVVWDRIRPKLLKVLGSVKR